MSNPKLLVLFLVIIAIVSFGCTSSGPCMQDPDRLPIDPGIEPTIIIDKVISGSSYGDQSFNGCATGRVFNVDYGRVRVRFYANGWPQPWFESFMKVNADGTWYCKTRRGEVFKACLISEPGYLEDQGTPFDDDNISEGWTLLDCDTVG